MAGIWSFHLARGGVPVPAKYHGIEGPLETGLSRVQYCVVQDAEMSSEESDVDLDMDLVLAEPDPDEPHEMGDPNKKGRSLTQHRFFKAVFRIRIQGSS